MAGTVRLEKDCLCQSAVVDETRAAIYGAGQRAPGAQALQQLVRHSNPHQLVSATTSYELDFFKQPLAERPLRLI